MNHLTFAIIPDESAAPSALFAALGDALAWALNRYGSDRFRISSRSVIEVERDVDANMNFRATSRVSGR